MYSTHFLIFLPGKNGGTQSLELANGMPNRICACVDQKGDAEAPKNTKNALNYLPLHQGMELDHFFSSLAHWKIEDTTVK